jgi:hypothetical protein
MMAAPRFATTNASGCTLIPVNDASNPVLDQDTRQGAKLTAWAERERPVMERAIAAASLENLEGCAIDFPVTTILYWLNLALSVSINA